MKQTLQTYFHESMALSHASFFAMNTNMELVLWDVNRDFAEFVFQQIYAETIRIEDMLNRFDPQSEVYMLNNAGSEEVRISEELFNIIQQCRQINEQTNGFFDVCIGATYLMDEEKCAVLPRGEKLNFDFGAYGKGYVLDRIREIFVGSSVENALVNFGNSSILVTGHHPKGDHWKVSLQHSYDPKISVCTFDLYDEVLTTSGVLPTKKEHIRSPRSGKFCMENATYSVVTKTAVAGEAITTALYAAQDIEKQRVLLQNFETRRVVKVRYGEEGYDVEEVV